MAIDDDISKKIVESTLKQISVNGYNNISLRKITKINHVTTGSFYLRFKNKNDLLLAAAKSASFQLNQEIISQVNDYSSNPQEALMKLGLWIINQFSKRPNLMEFLFFNEVVSITAYQSPTLNTEFPLLNLARKIVTANVENPKNVDSIFIQLWSFIQGYGNLIDKGVCKINKQVMMDAMLKLISE